MSDLMPRLSLLIAPLSLALVAGCVDRTRTEVAEIADEPVHYDEAMLLRDWPLTQRPYGSGELVAGPAYFNYEYVGTSEYGLAGTAGTYGTDGALATADSPASGIRGTATDVETRLMEPVIFLGNLAVLPIRMVQVPPWRSVTYNPQVVPPSYHAVPPLEEEGREVIDDEEIEVGD